jgi:hypothetical protein
MSMTIERTTIDERDLILDLVEGDAGAPTIEDWLQTMWGIRPGESSSASQAVTTDLSPGIASWLYRLYGLAALPLT